MTETDHVGPTISTVGRHVRLADILLLAVVPAAVVAVFSLPLATREALVFEYARPSVRDAVTAPFVHFDEGHIAFNLFGYALVVAALYALTAATERYRQFRVVFISLLLTTPVLLSYLNLAIVRSGVTYGFSGVLMALYGYLPLVIAQHLDAELEVGRARTVGPLFFFVGLTLVTAQVLRAVLANPVTVTVRGTAVGVTWVLVATLCGLLVGLAFVLALYVLSVFESGDGRLSGSPDLPDRTGHFELAVLAGVFFLAVPFVTFPADPIVEGSVVNLYVHFLGYALGFVASYVYSVL